MIYQIIEESPMDGASQAPKQETNFTLVSHLGNKYSRKPNSWQQLLSEEYWNSISRKNGKEIRPFDIYTRAPK